MVFCCCLFCFLFRFYWGKWHLQVEKHNFIIYKVIISKTKLYGNNNDRVEYSVSCNGCNSNDGVKEALKCWVSLSTVKWLKWILVAITQGLHKINCTAGQLSSFYYIVLGMLTISVRIYFVSLQYCEHIYQFYTCG